MYHERWSDAIQRRYDQVTTFVGVWEQIIHELQTDDGGARFTTAESYECALKSFRKFSEPI